MSNFLRPMMRTLFTAIGGALPTANPLHRGSFAVKQAASTADELHVGLKNSSGTMEFERVLTEDYADTLYTRGIIVEEGNLAIDNEVTTLDFDASDFTLSESPEDEINISLNYGTSAGTPAEGNHNHDADYVELTGDTMTGALLIDADSITAFEVQGDDDGLFAITTAAGSPRLVVDTVNFSGAGAANFANGMRLRGYSDSFSTLQFEMDGSNGNLTLGSGVRILTGTGDPEGVHTAPVGSLFLRTDGGSGTTLYVKESGTGNTGWSTTA